MNIIEAIKSGKRFKRKHASKWHDFKNGGIYYTDIDGDYVNLHNLRVNEVLADDWEIEEKRVGVSAKDLNTLFFQYRLWQRKDDSDTHQVQEFLLKELGLED